MDYWLASIYKASGLTPALSINKGRKLGRGSRGRQTEGRERTGLLEAVLTMPIIAESSLTEEEVHRKREISAFIWTMKSQYK